MCIFSAIINKSRSNGYSILRYKGKGLTKNRPSDGGLFFTRNEQVKKVIVFDSRPIN